jgi:hypothetical protein
MHSRFALLLTATLSLFGHHLVTADLSDSIWASSGTSCSAPIMIDCYSISGSTKTYGIESFTEDETTSLKSFQSGGILSKTCLVSG